MAPRATAASLHRNAKDLMLKGLAWEGDNLQLAERQSSTGISRPGNSVTIPQHLRTAYDTTRHLQVLKAVYGQSGSSAQGVNPRRSR